MRITRARAGELGLITVADDCRNCDACEECIESGVRIENDIDIDCPLIDEERLRDEMTDEEYDAWRHNRLIW